MQHGLSGLLFRNDEVREWTTSNPISFYRNGKYLPKKNGKIYEK